jgi:cytochrome c oxidase assembly factor CtaG
VTVVAHADHTSGGDAAGFVGAVVLVGLLASVYLLATAGDPRGSSRWRSTAWLAGCTSLGVAASPLLDGDAQVHMVQHLMLGMFAPLGLVMGAPVTLLLRRASPPVRRLVVRMLRSSPAHVLSHPVTAAVLSTGGLFAVLLTPLYAEAEQHPLLHHGLHLHYLAAGYLFVWAIAGPDPAPGRPGMWTRTLTLLVAAAGHAVLAKFLYAHAGVLPPGAGEQPDAVRAAAQLMYYGGDAAELLLAVALFAGWYRRRDRRLVVPSAELSGGHTSHEADSGIMLIP